MSRPVDWFWALACLGAAAALAAPFAAGCGGCEDEDGDGFCAEEGRPCEGCELLPADCDDGDPETRPGARDVGGDGIDRNCDGADTVEDCSARYDVDFDGLFGCDDPDCTDACAAGVANACVGASPLVLEPRTVHELDQYVPSSPAPDLFRPSCYASTVPETVLRVVVPGPPEQAGTFSAWIAHPARAGLQLLGTCAVPSSEIACDAPPSLSEPDASYVEAEVQGGTTLTVVANFESSGYATDLVRTGLRFVPRICGDGFVALGEACDDGNVVSGDGCSSACEAELPELCASAPALTDGATLATTLDGSRAFSGSCVGAGGHERLFAYTAPAAGALRVALESATRQGVYLRRGCVEELDCAVQPRAGVATVAAARVEAGETVTIVVDGASPAAAGPFRLTALFDEG